MAQGLGFIEFSTGDVLSAAAANGYLASQTVMVFANAAARTSAITTPYEGMFSYLKDTNATEYYTGSAWAALGGGGGGGKVLQVVMGNYTTPTVTVSSTTYTDTGMSASITPSASTSKVLVLTSQPFYMYKSGAEMAIGLKVLRGATVIADLGGGGGDSGWYMNTTSGSRADMQGRVAYSYLDSPATTSATTYKMQGATYGSGAVAFSNGSTPATIILMEIGA